MRDILKKIQSKQVLFFTVGIIIGFVSLGQAAEEGVEQPSFATVSPPLPTTYSPQTFWHSLMTKWTLEKEAYDQSYKHALKALEGSPLESALQINLGNALEGLGSLSKARDAYATAEKLTKDPSIHFQSRFNQAQAFAKEKKIEEALAYYQKALELDPSSKVVKTNIELLLSTKGGKGGQGNQSQNQDQDKNQNQEDNEGDDQSEEPKEFAENPKSGNKSQEKEKQPQDLSPGDIKKILEELKQQEQKIRGDYYKQSNREQKQKGRDNKREKDW